MLRDVNQTQLTTTYPHPQTRSNQAIKHPCDWTIGAEPLTALEIEIDVLLGMFVVVIATCWQDGTWVQHVETRVDNVFGASPHNQEVRVSQPAAVSSLHKKWHSLESDTSNCTPTLLCYMTGVSFLFLAEWWHAIWNRAICRQCFVQCGWTQVGFILWEPQMCIPTFLTIHPTVVELVTSGAKWWYDWLGVD